MAEYVLVYTVLEGSDNSETRGRRFEVILTKSTLIFSGSNLEGFRKRGKNNESRSDAWAESVR